MKNRKGFTLIELLVVVLIIGILASVALPQYQKAVAKSRAAAILPLLKSFVNAEEIFFMANGQYTYDINELDVDLPSRQPATCRSVASQTCYDVNGWSFEIFRANPLGGEPVSIEMWKDSVIFASYFEATRRAMYGKLTCIAHLDKEEGHQICKSLGGKRVDNSKYYIMEINP